VPLPAVKSPPWAMNSVITRWNLEPFIEKDERERKKGWKRKEA
jgi:hypothetical protein